MKSFIASVLILAPVLALTAGSVAAATDKPADAKSSVQAKKAAKPVAKKTVTKAKVAPKAAAVAVASVATAAVLLTPDELSIAQRVHTGRIACELGAHVNVNAIQQSPGYFQVDGKGFKYSMVPVATSTGTVRLEDKQAGAVWLQIANKSMLMNQKLGQRLADECMSPEQLQVAEAIKKNPPPSVFDPLPSSK